MTEAKSTNMMNPSFWREEERTSVFIHGKFIGSGDLLHLSSTDEGVEAKEGELNRIKTSIADYEICSENI